MLPPDTMEVTNEALTFLQIFYTLLLPAVIGSLACAEERHYGTLDGQLLLPISSSTQWIVKSATALGLAIILAVLLPVVLTRTFGGRPPLPGPRNPIYIEVALLIVVVATGISLYVSTLARSGLRALVASIGAIFAFTVVVRNAIGLALGLRVFQMVRALRPAHTRYSGIMIGRSYTLELLGPVALVAVMVVLALPNFRYVARRPPIIAMHAALVIAGVIAYVVLVSAIMALTF